MSFSFLLRWYALFNARLVLINARLPKDADVRGLDPGVARSLNERRVEAQRLIHEQISGHENECADCGVCCLEDVERYTPFDQYIMAGLGRPLDHYSGRIFSPRWMISNGLSHTYKRFTSSKRKPPPCRHLSPEGCRLESELKPMLCVSWFCPKYLRSLSAEELERLAPPLREMEAIHRDVCRSVKNSVRKNQISLGS